MTLSTSLELRILNEMSSHIAVLDRSGNIRFTNKAWDAFAHENGLPDVRWNDHNYLDVCAQSMVTDPAVKHIHSEFAQLLSRPQHSFSLEYPCHAPDRARWFEVFARTIPDSKYVLVEHKNITPRSEEALEHKLVFEYNLTPLFTSTPEKFLRINRAAHIELGYDYGELIGASPLTLYAHKEQRAELLDELLTTGIVSGKVVKLKRKDNSLFDALVYLQKQVINGETHFHGGVINVDEKRALQERIERIERLETVGVLAGGIAHDFNNLLTIIHSNLEFSLAEDALPLGVRDDLSDAFHATQKAAALTQQLMYFGRKQISSKSLTDLNVVIKESEPLITKLMGGRDFDIAYTNNPVQLFASKEQLGRVVMNLALNARHATPSDGRVRIASSNSNIPIQLASNIPFGQYGVLRVSDTGMGMDEATKNRIFEPFYTTKPIGEGTGLGLSTVHNIVQEHNGYVTVETALGRGTTFNVYFPRAQM